MAEREPSGPGSRGRVWAPAERLRAIQAVTDVALSHLALDDLLQALLGRIRDVLRADTAAVLLLSDDGQYLVPRASDRLSEEAGQEARGLPLPVGEGLAGRVAASRKPLVVDDLSATEAPVPIRREKIRSLVGAPLLVDGGLIGVIQVGSVRRRRFTREDVELLQLVADRVALAIERSRLYEDAVRARDEAEATRHRVFTILESITDAFFGLDDEWRFTYVNAGAERLLRRRREDLLGRSVWDEFPEAVGTTFWREYHRAVAERVSVAFEEFYPPLGLWVEVHAYPADYGLSVYFQDVTERKRAEAALRESEQRFRQLADAMPQLVWTASPDGNVDYYNERHREFQGIAKEQGGSWQWAPVVHPDDLSATGEAWERALRTGSTYEIAHRVLRADGTYRWYLSRGVPVRDDQGRIVRWYGTATDIDDQKRAQVEREDYVNVISHDLRAPLTIILGQAQLIQRFPERTELVRKNADAIVVGARRMTAMIQDLVDAARLEAGQMKLTRVPVDLRQFVLDVRSRMALALTGRDDRIRVEAPAELPPVFADPVRLERILMNLLTNALKYSPPDTPVEVSLARRDGEVVTSVSDHGRGIPPEEMPRLFERYYRVKGPGDCKEGLGLGLYIVRGLVEAHGGRVWATSEVGKGSTFSFSLPVG